MTEELKLQIKCAMWLHDNRQDEKLLFRRIKNELDGSGRNRMQQLNENKLSGIVAGTWDSFYLRKPMTWIEFKYGKGTLSEAQKTFMDIGLELGHEFYIIRSLEVFKIIIDGFNS